nr:MAG TPA: hypothetical protein [Caudoviricetes sp.]
MNLRRLILWAFAVWLLACLSVATAAITRAVLSVAWYLAENPQAVLAKQ